MQLPFYGMRKLRLREIVSVPRAKFLGKGRARVRIQAWQVPKPKPFP